MVIAAALFVANYTDNAPKIYTINDILENYDSYIGTLINVDGYYYARDNSIISLPITSGQQSTVVYKMLPVDISALDAVPASDIKYRFTGVLQSDQTNPVSPITLVVETAAQV